MEAFLIVIFFHIKSIEGGWVFFFFYFFFFLVFLLYTPDVLRAPYAFNDIFT
jgi:hypothetical protein